MRAPVLCSDTPIFRETSGGAAIFFEPTNSIDLAERARSLLDSDVAQTLRERGRLNVQRFVWSEAVAQTRAAYAAAVKAFERAPHL
jgi:hypothetical protein